MRWKQGLTDYLSENLRRIDSARYPGSELGWCIGEYIRMLDIPEDKWGTYHARMAKVAYQWYLSKGRICNRDNI